jgi:hypothetical protein
MNGQARFRPRLLLLCAAAVAVPIGLVWWFWCGPSTTLVLVRFEITESEPLGLGGVEYCSQEVSIPLTFGN